MYDKFQLILNQIQLDIPTLRYIISSRKVFESLDILGQNFMISYFFREHELHKANEQLKHINKTHQPFFIKDTILSLGLMPRKLICAEDYKAIDSNISKSLYKIRNIHIMEIIIELIYFKGIKRKKDKQNYLPKIMQKVLVFPVPHRYSDLILT